MNRFEFLFLDNQVLELEEIDPNENIDAQNLTKIPIIIVKLMYFFLTTLSTVGYGDFYPSSISEKIVGIFIEIVGVTIFSILMNQFIDVVLSFKSEDDSVVELKLN